jgi:hypothetical protein
MKWWGERDLNPRPRRYERPALTAELSPHVNMDGLLDTSLRCYDK